MPRVANGLIAYGRDRPRPRGHRALALVWAGGRFASLGGRIETQVASIADTLDKTAAVLQDASSSATSFAVTLERTPPIVRQVADAVGDIETSLKAVSHAACPDRHPGPQPARRDRRAGQQHGRSPRRARRAPGAGRH
jgi:hypothetical protein